MLATDSAIALLAAGRPSTGVFSRCARRLFLVRGWDGIWIWKEMALGGEKGMPSASGGMKM